MADEPVRVRGLDLLEAARNAWMRGDSKEFSVTYASEPPAQPRPGHFWVDTSTQDGVHDAVYVWNGKEWEQ